MKITHPSIPTLAIFPPSHSQGDQGQQRGGHGGPKNAEASQLGELDPLGDLLTKWGLDLVKLTIYMEIYVYSDIYIYT